MYSMNSEIGKTVHLESNLSICIPLTKYVHGLIQLSSTLFSRIHNKLQQPHLGIKCIYLYMEGLLEPSLLTTYCYHIEFKTSYSQAIYEFMRIYNMDKDRCSTSAQSLYTLKKTTIHQDLLKRLQPPNIKDHLLHPFS